jgi:hypothetical protein
MTSGEDELIRYYHQVLEEVKIRAERIVTIERQIDSLLGEVKRGDKGHAPIVRVMDLARYSGMRSEKLRGIKDLYGLLEEARNDLEMAERRKLDVLEELHEHGIAPGTLSLD